VRWCWVSSDHLIMYTHFTCKKQVTVEEPFALKDAFSREEFNAGHFGLIVVEFGWKGT